MIRLIIAIIFSWIIVGYFIKDIEKNYFELALGTQTSEYYAKGDNNELIHSGGLNTFEQLYIDWSKRGKNDIILLLGNSQYHAINQMKPEDINLSQILYNHFKKQKIDRFPINIRNIGALTIDKDKRDKVSKIKLFISSIISIINKILGYLRIKPLYIGSTSQRL